MLEKEHGIVAPDGRAQQAVGIQRRGGTDHPQARAVGEDRGTRLRVIHGAADVAAVRRAHDERSRKGVVRAPAHGRQLVTQLHVRGPDVIEELHFDDGLEPAVRQPDRTADDIRLGERRIVDPMAAELLLQPPGDLEHATLSLHVAKVLLARHVGHVLSEKEDAVVPAHFVPHADVEQVHHRGGLSRELRIVLGVELLTRGIHVRRVHAEQDGVGGRLRLRERVIGRGQHLGVDRGPDRLEVGFRGVPLVHEPLREHRERITRRVRLALRDRAVHHFVVRQRVAVRTDDLRMHEGRSLPLSRVVDRPAHHLIRGEKVAAIHLLHEQVRKGAHQPRDRPTGGIHFHRHRDRVAVVLHQINDGQPEVRRGIERLPEFPLAGLSLTGRDEDDLVAMEPVGYPDPCRPDRRFRRTHRLQKLGAGGRRYGDDVEFLVSPVRRHLSPARVGVGGRAHGRVQHFRCRHPELEAKRAIAIVQVEPVVAGLEQEAAGGGHGFVPRARDLEEDLVLSLELNLLVVQPARQEHGAIGADELVAGKAGGGAACLGRSGHGWRENVEHGGPDDPRHRSCAPGGDL